MELLDLLGGGYVTKCVMAAAEFIRREEAYRVYETDILLCIGKRLGLKSDKRYYDILHPQPEDNRPGDEIAVERLERFGIKVVG